MLCYTVSPRTLPLLCSKSFMTSPPILSSSSPLSPTGSAVPICGPSNGSPSSHETHECHSDCCISPSSERLPLSAIPLSSCQSTMPTPTLSQTTSLPTQNPGTYTMCIEYNYVQCMFIAWKYLHQVTCEIIYFAFRFGEEEPCKFKT